REAPHSATYAFAHSLVRDGLYRRCAADRRALLHMAAGRALAARAVPDAEVARHFERGAVAGDVMPAMDALRRLSRVEASAGELVRAAEALDRAIDVSRLGPRDEVREIDLALDAAEAWLRARATDRARSAFERVL